MGYDVIGAAGAVPGVGLEAISPCFARTVINGYTNDPINNTREASVTSCIFRPLPYPLETTHGQTDTWNSSTGPN